MVSAYILINGISQDEFERSQLCTKHLVCSLSILQEKEVVSKQEPKLLTQGRR